MNRKGEAGFLIGGVIFIVMIIVLIGILIGGGVIYKNYKVWALEKDGQADLAKAEWTKKIAIEEAKAMKESAILIAEADIERAKGIAEANNIIAESITDEYLKYKFIEGLNDGNTEVVYVPTEANIPILEVNR